MEGLAHLLGQIPLAELAGRQVDRHAQLRQPGPAPGHRLPAGLVHGPGADGGDQPGLLGQGNKVAGGDHPPVRMVPAQQRLAADDATADEIDLRLVVQAKFLTLQGVAQAVFQFEGRQHLLVHLGGVKGKGAAVPLRLVHGAVGVAHQGGDVPAVAGIETDAETGGEDDFPAVEVIGFGEVTQNFVGHQPGVLDRGQLGQQQDELVPAEARHRIRLAHRLLKAPRHFTEQPVAKVMAETVVDELKAVQVEKQNRHQPLGTLRVVNGLFQAIGEQRPVGQSGQFVVGGEIFQLRLIGFAFGDVLLDRHVMSDDPRRIDHRRDRSQFPEVTAIFSAVADFAVPFLAGGELFPKFPVAFRRVVPRLQDPHVLAADLFQGIAGDSGEFGVDVFDASGGIGDNHGGGALFHGQAQFPQFFLGRLALGDVRGDFHAHQPPVAPADGLIAAIVPAAVAGILEFENQGVPRLAVGADQAFVVAIGTGTGLVRLNRRPAGLADDVSPDRPAIGIDEEDFVGFGIGDVDQGRNAVHDRREAFAGFQQGVFHALPFLAHAPFP